MGKIQVKRVYEPAEKSDGFRVLVDRLWPRGISKERAALDLWMKEIAPSDELRRWFAHDPARWKEFQTRYRAELKEHQSDLADLKAQTRKRTVTLLFGARDAEHNEAVVPRENTGRVKPAPIFVLTDASMLLAHVGRHTTWLSLSAYFSPARRGTELRLNVPAGNHRARMPLARLTKAIKREARQEQNRIRSRVKTGP